MKPKNIYIDANIVDLPETLKFKGFFKDTPCLIVNDVKELFENIQNANDPIQKGKETIFLTQNKGAFIKKCPGTSYYNCCGYKILHIGTFCNMDCSYCILQAYFHPPIMQYFVNHEALLEELNAEFASNTVSRIGTGEFTDSMIWERWTDLSKLLVPLFANQTSSILELKTKTVLIDNLKNLKHNRKTILAWSLNTDFIVKTEERYTASINQRLKAAKLCESWGYPIAFHFDPLVIYEGCEQDYRNIIARIFDYVKPENIAWISIGSFRHMPLLKPIIQKRFPDSKIIYGEFILGLDGKMRYFKPLRISLYQTIVSAIKDFSKDILVYFCMEDDEVWEKTFGFIPKEKRDLNLMLDESAIKHCGLN
ncbi:MAG: DNA photolyase [Desulfobacterales bacterium]|nr:DNA photolyase [Desulfobacterales bacterium]